MLDHRSRTWWASLAFALLFLAVGQTQFVNAQEEVNLPFAPAISNISSGQEFFKDAVFSGSESCQECHKSEYADWQETWHAHMEHEVSPERIIADFNDVTLSFNNPKKLLDETGKTIKEGGEVTLKLHRDGDKFLFTIIDALEPANNQTHEVAIILGGNWEQHYEAQIDDNRFPTPMRWVVADGQWRSSGYNPGYWWVWKDGRAVPRTPAEFLEINYRAAEVKCAGCHQGGYEAVYDESEHTWSGSRVELGIGCEKCHGPGSLHIAEAEEAGGAEAKLSETTIINPIVDLDSVQQTQMCGQCHIRGNDSHTYNEFGKKKAFGFPTGFIPGDRDLHERFIPWSFFSEGKIKSFWPNNQNRKNRQQYLDYTQSEHYKEGVTCSTCHVFHGEWEGRQLRLPVEELCVACHNEQGEAYRPNKEMFEGSPMEVAGVQCVNCHMPNIAYGSAKTEAVSQHWDRTSHTFKAITPDFGIQWGMRTACDQCHVPPEDQPLIDVVKTSLMLTPEQGLEFFNNHQSNTQKLLDDANAAVAIAEQVIQISKDKGVDTTAAELLVFKARANIDFVLRDGSMGIHNIAKTYEVLTGAVKLTNEALLLLE